MITRPLLAGTIKDITEVKYPVLVTPKLDGIRCLKVNGEVVTRKFKPVPNRFLRETLEKILPDGIDGEIMLSGESDFNNIQSAVMSFDGEPDFLFNAFDYVKDDLEKPYAKRIEDMKKWYQEYMKSINEDPKLVRVKLVLPLEAKDSKHLEALERMFVGLGYEGVIVRSYEGKYKCGRSTLREGILLKLKRFNDAEAEVIGFKEKMTNTNEQEKDEFGLVKRSSKKEGLIGANTLGTLLVKDRKSGIEFGVGSGFDDELREKIWSNQDKYLGQLVKYKYQELSKDSVPRFPVFLGFRSELDIS